MLGRLTVFDLFVELLSLLPLLFSHVPKSLGEVLLFCWKETEEEASISCGVRFHTSHSLFLDSLT